MTLTNQKELPYKQHHLAGAACLNNSLLSVNVFFFEVFSIFKSTSHDTLLNFANHKLHVILIMQKKCFVEEEFGYVSISKFALSVSKYHVSDQGYNLIFICDLKFAI